MAFQPMPLSRRPAPFDHPEWVFELKLDGFRSLAVIHDGRCELISRNGHPFNSFDTLRKAMTAPGDGKTVLDGEIGVLGNYLPPPERRGSGRRHRNLCCRIPTISRFRSPAYFPVQCRTH